MHVIFDIDGTLADATHRMHLIKDMTHWVSVDGKPPRPNWESFLSDAQLAKDRPIPQTWAILESLLREGHDIMFITARNERSRAATYEWLTDELCEYRYYFSMQEFRQVKKHKLYMRSNNDRRPSHEVKRDLLMKARNDGFNPKLAFEDRKADADMWRSEGLLCCQVADGDF